MAFQLKDDAQTMESFTGMNVSWQTHAGATNQIKEHVNALARQVDELKAVSNSASPCQKTVINQIDPYLEEMNGYTEASIENLSKHPERPRTPEYKDHIEANADYAGDLIADFVDYGRTKERLQKLTDKLEVPAH